MGRDLTISGERSAALGYPHAGVAELADAPGLGPGAGNGLGVRVPPPALMTQTRAELIRLFLPASPFAAELGIELADLRPGHAELRLPWSPRLATMGEVVHGGAVATLLDTAGMAAAWSDDAIPDKPAGSTVSMSVSFAAPAVATDLIARAAVVRRGRSMCFCQVTVVDGAGDVVAHGSMVHR